MKFLPSKSNLSIQISSISLLHSAYSVWEGRQYSKSIGEEIPITFGSPVPLDIIIQTLISCILLIIGVNWSTSTLKEISWASEMRTRSIDSEDSQMSFMKIRHRGSLLHREKDS